MKKFWIILVVIIVLGAAGWFFFLRDDGQEGTQDEQTQKQDFPLQYDAGATPTELTGYESAFDNLSFQYPNNWNVVESAENSEEEQLITVESPMDTNEFYFCLDFNMFGAGIDNDFTTSDAQVVASNQLESGRYAVIYTLNEIEGMYWSVVDSNIEVGATTFANEMVSDSGARLQAFGRFNCRDTTKADLSVEEMQNSQWLHEAEAIVNSLEF